MATSLLTVGTADRRARPRTSGESRATTLIQQIWSNASAAAADLENDLRDGADPAVTFALLTAAGALASLRGLDLRSRIVAIVARLKQDGFQP
jgi:hypothetical protein